GPGASANRCADDLGDQAAVLMVSDGPGYPDRLHARPNHGAGDQSVREDHYLSRTACTGPKHAGNPVLPGAIAGADASPRFSLFSISLKHGEGALHALYFQYVLKLQEMP